MLSFTLKTLVILYFLLNTLYCTIGYGINFSRAEGPSMYPTMASNCLEISYNVPNLKIKRGDIVEVFSDNKTPIIKRIIGTPGDSIKIVDGIFYINGEKYNEPYVAYKDRSYETMNKEEIVLGNDEYYICGDNRNNSHDSRYYGPIKRDQICGVVIFDLKIPFISK